MAVASAGPCASLHHAPDRQPRQHLTTCFLQAVCPSCRPTNSVKTLKANSLLFGTTRENISKLQKAQNLACVVTHSCQSCSQCTLLQQLHWLPIKHCIDFKIANITFCTLHSSQLAYLRSSLHALISLVPSDSPTLISSLLCLSAHHLALTASTSQP